MGSRDSTAGSSSACPPRTSRLLLSKESWETKTRSSMGAAGRCGGVTCSCCMGAQGSGAAGGASANQHILSRSALLSPMHSRNLGLQAGHLQTNTFCQEWLCSLPCTKGFGAAGGASANQHIQSKRLCSLSDAPKEHTVHWSCRWGICKPIIFCCTDRFPLCCTEAAQCMLME